MTCIQALDVSLIMSHHTRKIQLVATDHICPMTQQYNFLWLIY